MEKVEKGIVAFRHVEEGRATWEAHASVFACWEGAPDDVWLAAVKLAVLDLIQGKKQRGREAVRLVVVRNAQRSPAAACAAPCVLAACARGTSRAPRTRQREPSTCIELHSSAALGAYTARCGLLLVAR